MVEKKESRRIIFTANTSWYFLNFRMGLLRAFAEAGYEVYIAAPEDEYSSRVEDEFPLFRYALDNKGTNPFRDLKTLVSLRKIYRSVRPSAAVHFTIKPNIYGTIAAGSLGIPIVNTVTGLGNVFTNRRWVTGFVKTLYRIAFGMSRCVFFQNEEDRSMFVRDGLVSRAKTDIIAGSGIDTGRFVPRKKGKKDGLFRFLLLARLLWDKGIGEYVEAARSLKKRFPQIECQLLGFLEAQNPKAISRETVEMWVGEGIITFLGHADDVRPFIAEADCVVLPSYREGIPKSLLEAASMEKPIIATQVPGCGEVVKDRINGYLCRPKDAADLAKKMEVMFLLPPGVRNRMGTRGREWVMKNFEEKLVVEKYLKVLERICEKST